MNAIPQKTNVLVVGGGPAGSTAAGLLAREGFDVTLLEQAQFPRYHIGESLLPTILPILELLGIREKVEARGFQQKQGAYLEWGSETWALDFGELSGNYTHAFQVRRDEFDLMMLENASELGAKVFQNVEVRSLQMDGDRPVRAAWQQKAVNGSQPQQGEISFDYLIDASGRNGLMANRYLKNRKYHNVFQNVGVWGYWKNTDRLATGREGDIAVGSIPNGWLWGIPLSDGTMSIGAVMHKNIFNQYKNKEMDAIYSEAIDASPLMRKITKNAELISEVKTESDYSYASEKFCGPGYFMVGDAACFLDPLLSSGVHLATMSAMLASASIISFTRGDVDEAESQSFFENSYRQAYLRFLVFLSAFYDVGRTKESYFWEAQRVTQQDVPADFLKLAFLNLVTGVKDLADIQSDETHHFVLEEMTKRIDDNLRWRQDKKALAGMQGEKLASVRENANFFDSIEGIFSINESEAIGGLYVTLVPTFGLARVKQTS
ncbi:MAG: FAD-binding protein [Chloroflexi bacterium 44-23]|nr:MAG: FAD-binding protein [Chloroflexi bacterium 44-23]